MSEGGGEELTLSRPPFPASYRTTVELLGGDWGGGGGVGARGGDVFSLSGLLCCCRRLRLWRWDSGYWAAVGVEGGGSSSSSSSSSKSVLVRDAFSSPKLAKCSTFAALLPRQMLSGIVAIFRCQKQDLKQQETTRETNIFLKESSPLSFSPFGSQSSSAIRPCSPLPPLLQPGQCSLPAPPPLFS